MKFTDVSIDMSVKPLNTKILGIHRSQRHQDILIAKQFWEDLSIFLNKKR